MVRQNLISTVLTTIFYLILIYFAISLIITIFPLLAGFLILLLVFFGAIWLYRYIKQRVNSSVNPEKRFDEHGSRYTKASVLEMKDIDANSQNNEKGQG